MVWTYINGEIFRDSFDFYEIIPVTFSDNGFLSSVKATFLDESHSNNQRMISYILNCYPEKAYDALFRNMWVISGSTQVFAAQKILPENILSRDEGFHPDTGEVNRKRIFKNGCSFSIERISAFELRANQKIWVYLENKMLVNSAFNPLKLKDKQMDEETGEIIAGELPESNKYIVKTYDYRLTSLNPSPRKRKHSFLGANTVLTEHAINRVRSPTDELYQPVQPSLSDSAISRSSRVVYRRFFKPVATATGAAARANTQERPVNLI